jgi:hypothetical protein
MLHTSPWAFLFWCPLFHLSPSPGPCQVLLITFRGLRVIPPPPKISKLKSGENLAVSILIPFSDNSILFYFFFIFPPLFIIILAEYRWLTPVILATWMAEIWRMAV